ncbi:AI-2E family transporter [Microbacterium aurantiacum]|uniref:AI-2E family transporter n=1 Tax=Microbacterium aurantiacum TaxID=162393 RepID=UPI000C8004C7|nr:AI-2E family transporter [Microbacterium aurantiacum]
MSDELRPRLRDILRPRPISTDRTVTTEADQAVPFGLRVGAGYAWRLLILAAAIGVFIWLVITLKLLVIPLMVGILITALLWPAFEWMLRMRFPRWLAVALSILGTLAIVTGLMWLVVWQIRVELPDVQASTAVSIENFQDWLREGPLHLTSDQISDYLVQAQALIEEQGQALWSGALAVGSTLGHVVTGALLSLFVLVCLLADGAGIWRWTVRIFPRNAQPAIDGAARNGWKTIVNYARTQLFVATIDAIGIGLGAFLLQVPLALPVAVLVFLGSFIPIVGAVATGAIAVFLALVYNGPWIALWMLVVVLGVQQVEGHILQPILMGSAVKVHPLAVVLVVAGGAMIGGIPGALFAVPLAAFVNVVAVTLTSGSWRTGAVPSGDLIWSTVPRQRRRSNR